MTNQNKPAIILVQPQMSENVGMTARAMMNCGLSDLRLVNPREDHLCDKAVSASAGAGKILKNAKTYNSTNEAVADLNMVFATTGRHRDMIKPVYTADLAAEKISNTSKINSCGILFGCERTGLENDDVCLADAIINIPLNPEHTSLNLSQAVLLVGYEWYKLQTDTPKEQLITNKTQIATKEQVINFLENLETRLDNCGNFKLDEKRPRMIRNLRNIFNRAQLTEQEINTLYGIFNFLSKN